MESNFFRSLASELGPALSGVRVEKVFRPAEQVFTFRLGLSGQRRYLLFRHGRDQAALFFSQEKPDNPERPDGRSMWLRKHLSGRRLFDHVADWPGRRLAWALSGQGESYFILDLREGPFIAETLEAGFGKEPEWPDFGAVCDDPDVWRNHPQISPLLRKAMESADPAEALKLYERVSQGTANRFFVYLSESGTGQALVWERPARAGERMQIAESALEAAALAGQSAVFGRVRHEAASDDAGALKARRKRVKRALAKVDEEEQRMRDLVACRDKALAVQSALSRVGSGDRLGEVAGQGPDGQDMVVELDSRLTVVENMQRLYRLAAKGERGLTHAVARRKELQAEYQALVEGRWTPPETQAPPPRIKSKRNLAIKDKAFARFVSSDGFTLLRGKNAKANAKLLREAAAPFDLWFHAQDGPGSHVLLKRDHGGQEPPEATMEEAAALAGLKSWQAQEAKARIMCALVRDVKPLKGAPAGTVRVDKIFRALVVDLDPELEQRLAVREA